MTDELISKQAAKNAIHKQLSTLDLFESRFNVEIDAIPAVDAEPVKHGQWVHNEEYEYWAERYVCSVCNRDACSDGDYRHELTNYCPNCGAKMDGGMRNE